MRRINRQIGHPPGPVDPGIQCCGIGVRPGNQPILPAKRLCPGQRIDIIFVGQHRRGVDRLPFKQAADKLAATGHPENFGQRPGGLIGFKSLDGARGQNEDAVAAFSAEHFLPGIGDHIELGPGHRHRKYRTRGIGDAEAGAIIGNPVAVRHPDTRGGAIPGENHIG